MNACIPMLTRPMAVMTISLLAIMLSMPQSVQAGDTTFAPPAFYLPFDHSLKSNDGQEPSQERGIKYVPGVLGEAAYIGGHGRQDYAKAPLLEYDTKDLFSGESGTAMFWVSPNWDGRYDNINNIPWYTFLATMGGQPKDKVDFTTHDIKPDSQRLTVFMYNWLRADIKQEKPAKTLSLKQGRWGWLKGDWFHVAVTWDTSGWCKLYVNGRPTSLRGKTAPGTDPQKTMVSLKDTQRMYIGSRPKTWTSSHRANAAIDEFQIFSKAISDEQVWQTYRQVMPLDIVLDQRFIRADQKQTLTLEVAPAGQLELPTSSWKTNSSINVALDVRLIRDTDNEVVAQQTHSLKVNHLQKITLPIPSIPQGNYRLTYGVKQGQYQYQKSIPIEVYTQASPLSSEDRDMTLGPAIVSIDATDPDQDFVSIGTSKIVKSAVGTYRQAGKNKMNRIAYRIDIPDEYIGQTMVVRITWPDDKPRSIGWYMYRDMIGDKTKQHRDRLGGGTQSGDEYPLTQTMRTTEYVFYPWTKQYLFSARTMISGYPAAIEKIELLPVIGRLPKLKINRPKNLPQRHFGHTDEDQSFEILMNFEKQQRFKPGYSVAVIERLLDYMDYTGQDTMAYPMIRYDYTFNTTPGKSPGASLRTAGWQQLMLDMMQQRGKRLIGTINGRTTTRSAKFPDQVEQLQKIGYYQINRYGKPVKAFRKSYHVNPMHPLAKSDILTDIGLIIKRYGSHPAFAGLDLWHLSGKGSWALSNSQMGYGDWTINKFEQDTGIDLKIDSKDPERFPKRYDLLMGKYVSTWLQWRADQNTQMVREIAQLATATNKNLKIHVTLENNVPLHTGGAASYLDFDPEKEWFQSASIDVQTLKTIKGIQPMIDGSKLGLMVLTVQPMNCHGMNLNHVL